jgi:hypothetical protein
MISVQMINSVRPLTLSLFGRKFQFDQDLNPVLNFGRKRHVVRKTRRTRLEFSYYALSGMVKVGKVVVVSFDRFQEIQLMRIAIMDKAADRWHL